LKGENQMIEIPEAEVLAQQISRSLNGKTIRQATANQSPHKFAWYSGDPAEYNRLLAGKTIHGACAFANFVQIHVDELRLALSTNLRYHAAGEKPPAKHQLLLEFGDGSALSATVAMWGGLLCLKPGEEGSLADFYQFALKRPSPLSAAFDRVYFDHLFGADTPGLSAKAFLATEQRIPGLGNGVLQDILWQARVHPKRKMGGLSNAETAGMFTALKTVLSEMTACGGRDTERDLFDHPGGYKSVLSKHTVGTPCPTCGTIIGKEAYMGGSIYFCPSCQEN
jgi:formamidopyrimidine-DNA glycosylase